MAGVVHKRRKKLPLKSAAVKILLHCAATMHPKSVFNVERIVQYAKAKCCNQDADHTQGVCKRTQKTCMRIDVSRSA